MTLRCSVFIATSLDGYIARPDGRIDWLETANQRVPAGEDCGYQAFMSTVDGLVMGRNTFDTVAAFADWPYGALPVTVLSRRPLPAELPPGVTRSDDAPAELVARLAAAGHRHLYIDGGITIQRFLAAGLIDRLTVTVIPVLLGAGRPLFGALPGDRTLRLASSRSYPFGFVQNTYELAPMTPQSGVAG